MIDTETYTAESTALLPTLYRIGYSILRNDADTQDAIQQALLKAWSARGSASPEKFRPWLTRIAINECHNIQRYRMRVSPVQDMEQPQAFDAPDVDVAAAIAALPEKWRIPVLLKYYACYTEREIAAAMGVPQTTIKNRLHRARQALRDGLTGREVTFE